MTSKTWLFSTVIVRALSCVLILAGLAGPTAQNSIAGLFTLVDANSIVNFNTDNSDNAYEWRVDGVNEFFQQAFWYRRGNVDESALYTLSHPIEGTTDTFPPDGNPDILFVRYNGSGFDIEVKYSLQGGSPGSRTSDLAEQIKIINTGAQPLVDFHFFQYVDFDLRDTDVGDSAVFPNINAVRQFEGLFEVAEAVITPAADHREIAPVPNTISKFFDGLPTTLSDSPSTGTVIGPGDLAWAFQWDIPSVPVGGSFVISKDKRLSGVPEPSSFILLTITIGFLLSLSRYQFSFRRDCG